MSRGCVCRRKGMPGQRTRSAKWMSGNICRWRLLREHRRRSAGRCKGLAMKAFDYANPAHGRRRRPAGPVTAPGAGFIAGGTDLLEPDEDGAQFPRPGSWISMPYPLADGLCRPTVSSGSGPLARMADVAVHPLGAAGHCPWCPRLCWRRRRHRCGNMARDRREPPTSAPGAATSEGRGSTVQPRRLPGSGCPAYDGAETEGMPFSAAGDHCIAVHPSDFSRVALAAAVDAVVLTQGPSGSRPDPDR